MIPTSNLGALLGAYKSDLRIVNEMLSLEERLATLRLRVALLEGFIGVLGLGQVILCYYVFFHGL